MQRPASPALRGVGVCPADTSVSVPVTRSGGLRHVTTGESGMWTDSTKRMGVGNLLARKGLEPGSNLRDSII